ncbi:hypothetical protein FSP39_001284 [Pinctada imbricata]|uniref:MAGE domain-containing protein n=1 Tax=Pinctada imbricata TaxID=66713 RepID=A0AA89C9K9_PINIB|nr:hypothetical protein FSP39_001284 [Pinctada imbricata]
MFSFQKPSIDESFNSSQMPGCSQATFTQAEKVCASIDSSEQAKLESDLVQYLLIMDQKKLPIKKIDINKNVLKENSRAFPVLISRAAKKLETVFGIRLISLEDKQKGTYILVNTLDTDIDDLTADHNVPQVINPVEWSEEDNAKTGLLMVILSAIFMNGEVMMDTQLWHMLKKVGIDPDYTHEEFGDIKKLITQEFVRQGYIDYIRHPNSDPPVFEFRWGARAKHEVLKRSCMDFVSQVFGIRLISLEDKQKGTYILVNTLDTDIDDLTADHNVPQVINPVEWSEEDNAKTGLLMVILSAIFMNGEVMMDTQLWHMLKKVGIDPDYTHEEFGDIKKLITQEFVRQGYIDYIRHPNSDPPVFEFRWGARAKHEVLKRSCMDFVSQLYEIEPEQWKSQWQMVLEEEQPGGQGD